MNRRFFMLASAAALAGCAGTQETPPPGQARAQAFYLLPRPDLPRAPDSGLVVGLREVRLPQYAADVRLSSLDSGGIVRREDDHMWAEDPARAITQGLAAALGARLGASVSVEPWPVGFSPQYRVETEFESLIGALGGTLKAAGKWRLLEGARGRLLSEGGFSYDIPAPGPGFDGIMKAVSAALERLSGDIAAKIAALRGES